MENDITERIELILKEYQLTPSAFSDKIDVQRSAMSHILSRRNRPSLDVIQKILKKFPEVNSSWLLNGTGKMKQLSLFEEDDSKPGERKESLPPGDLQQKNLIKNTPSSPTSREGEEKLTTKPAEENINFPRLPDGDPIRFTQPSRDENFSGSSFEPPKTVPPTSSNPASYSGNKSTGIFENRNTGAENFSYPKEKYEPGGINDPEKVNPEAYKSSQNNAGKESKTLEQATAMAGAFDEKEIDRIIIFYKDRTFVSYKPE